LEITGTHGRVQGNWTTGIVETWNQETLISREILPKTTTLVPMLKEFFHALQTDTPVPITGENGLWAVELAEACYQAAQTGQTISVT
jgi:predicted dehydrogenase